MNRDKRAEIDGCRIIATSFREREAIDRIITEFLSLSKSPFTQYSKMSLREIAALIDSRQETNGEYNFLVVYNTADGFVCFVRVRLSFYVHAIQLEPA